MDVDGPATASKGTSSNKDKPRFEVKKVHLLDVCAMSDWVSGMLSHCGHGVFDPFACVQN
jgi:hypothetical protein